MKRPIFSVNGFVSPTTSNGSTPKGFTIIELPTSPRLRRTCRRIKVFSSAFTIIELLVVISVIAILAAVTLVSYSGISNRAMLASLQSDLSSNSTQLKLYYAMNGMYPITLDGGNCPLTPVADTTKCLKFGSSTNFIYTPSNTTNPQSYSLAANKNGNYLSTSPIINTCPLNFIVVPGSVTYGTNDFCVMKYEAKQVGATTTPISTASGLPWVNISQTTAIANAPNVKNADGSTCSTCHLITEAEWLTIAQNVLSVASNWDNGAGVHTVGTGYIYSGHKDNSPGAALEASTDDTLGYTGTGNASGNQRRTLTLTNGEVIWDMAGNVWDWTAGTKTGGQPGVAGNAYASFIEWPNVTTLGTISPSVFPSGTGIFGASAWTSTNGIGQLLSNPAEAVAKAFLRGGNWGDGSLAGVLGLLLSHSAGDAGPSFGFRVSQ